MGCSAIEEEEAGSINISSTENTNIITSCIRIKSNYLLIIYNYKITKLERIKKYESWPILSIIVNYGLNCNHSHFNSEGTRFKSRPVNRLL
jgi:hypothetical protein